VLYPKLPYYRKKKPHDGKWKEEGGTKPINRCMNGSVCHPASQPLSVKEGEGEPEPGRRKAADDNLPYATNPVTST